MAEFQRDSTLKPKVETTGFYLGLTSQNKANLVRLNNITGNKMAFHCYATASELGGLFHDDPS
jgi:hypothetical protein